MIKITATKSSPIFLAFSNKTVTTNSILNKWGDLATSAG